MVDKKQKKLDKARVIYGKTILLVNEIDKVLDYDIPFEYINIIIKHIIHEWREL